MRPFLRFCASCAFLRPSLLVLFAAFAGHLAAQPAPVLADPTTGALYRPGAATFASYNNLLTLDGAAGSYLSIYAAQSTYLPITVAFNSYQQLDADLTSWAAVVRAGGFDTFVATPSSANLATLVTGETGSGALVFGTSPTFTTPTLGAATATSLTAPAATDLTLAGGTSGASLVLGQGGNGVATLSGASSGASIVASQGGTDTIFLTPSGSTSASQVRVPAGAAARPIFGPQAGSGIFFPGGGATGFSVGSVEAVRVSGNLNLLIGTTTDISGTGGLHVAGTSTASTTTSGALRVGSNIGLSGNAGGASYFGGNLYTTSATPLVGIGTTNPLGAIPFFQGGSGMEIKGSGATSLAISGSIPYLWFQRVGGGIDQKSYSLFVGASSVSLVSLTDAGSTRRIFLDGNTNTGLVTLGEATSGVNITSTTSASSSTVGALTIGNGTAATNVAIGAGNINAGGTLVVGGTVIHTLSATPASASAAGTVGTMSWDANYIYICTSTNTWKRVAIATW